MNAGDIIEVFALALLGTVTERQQWLDRRTADLGDPRIQRDRTRPLLCSVTQSIAATGAARPDAATDWAHMLRITPLAPGTDRVAQWLQAGTEIDGTFAKPVEPLARAGLPEIPILDVLIHLDLAQHTTGSAQHAARTRIERALINFGGERLLTALFASDSNEG